MARTLNARSCEVRQLDDATAQDFVSEHHRAGAALVASALVSLGLFYEGELVGVAQFCYPRTAAMQRKYTTELLRLAFPETVRVRGGASKLLAYYRRVYNPADIFTYQDATGELTDVYEKAGFTLVSQAKKKQYLVAPGKTLETASRKEALGMAYATRYGPDRILGTKLGEIFRSDGKRKTNAELFVEELGWHIEETAGDRIYEWFNPNVTFYTYKITAADSDKYYYGVSHVKKANATVEDCLNDGYFGSGGVKFQNWVKRHPKLAKQVLGLFTTKAAAYQAEAKLVGDKHSFDPLCLNSSPGGLRAAPPQRVVNEKICPTHGLTSHRGDSCIKCSMEDRDHLSECPLHGEATHRGDVCLRCMVAGTFEVGECDIHGFTTHRRGACVRCSSAKAFKVGQCAIHGEVTLRGESCTKCLAVRQYQDRVCPIHGLVTHQSKVCLKCKSDSATREELCPKHGLTPHRGSHCFKCAGESLYHLAECSIHGLVNHKGSVCVACQNSATVRQLPCSIHGLAAHQGDTCLACSSQKQVSVRSCPVHGETKFRGDFCFKCMNAPKDKECPIHGVTAHRGNSCFKCSRPAIKDEKCKIHGLTPHRGGACIACANEKRVHTRYHKSESKAECRLCSAALEATKQAQTV